MASAQVRSDRYTRDGYTHGAIVLHWTIAALIVANLALGLLHENLLDGIKWVIPIHKAIGISVIALTIGRIGWRIAHPVPPLPATMPVYEKFAAHAVHYLLYFYMLALPITGWMMSSAGRRRPISWFGLVDVPFLPVDKAQGDWAHGAHGILGWILLALLVLHVGAALRHHFLLRDGILARMIPVAGRRI